MLVHSLFVFIFSVIESKTNPVETNFCGKILYSYAEFFVCNTIQYIVQQCFC